MGRYSAATRDDWQKRIANKSGSKQPRYRISMIHQLNLRCLPSNALRWKSYGLFCCPLRQIKQAKLTSVHPILRFVGTQMELRTVLSILFVTLLVMLGENEVDGWRRRRRRRWVPPPPQPCTVSGRNMFCPCCLGTILCRTQTAVV